MSKHKNWLLPEGFQEILPPLSFTLEEARKQILDNFYRHGYDFVNPPMLEFVESLSPDRGFLDLATFKVTDQKSGKMLALRADITPQIARINRHYLADQAITRLCYFGAILQTGRNSNEINREQMQFGAELYGSQSIDADYEIVQLALCCLETIGIDDLVLTLGDMGILREIISQMPFDLTKLNSESKKSVLLTEFSSLINRRSITDIRLFVEQYIIIDQQQSLISFWQEYLQLIGDAKTTIAKLQTLCEKYQIQLSNAIERFLKLANLIEQSFDNIHCQVDMALQHNYDYHTGFVFYIYHPKRNLPVVKGGRYDDNSSSMKNISTDSAVGFSADMYQLLSLVKLDEQRSINSVIVNRQKYLDELSNNDVFIDLQKKIKALREAKHQVIVCLEEQTNHAIESMKQEKNFTHELVLQDNQWQLIAL